MKSSSGKYFIGLDHIRAVAIFIIFTWHFNRFGIKHLLPPYVFPLSLLSEGHTGVALFMTLSGYLFAKLLDGKNIKYSSFLWNRLLRLSPLFFLVIIFVGFQVYLSGGDLFSYVKSIVAGLGIEPSLPNGGWAIIVEFHFYLILPALLFLTTRWKYSLIFLLLAAVFLRALLHHDVGEIQTLSFWTIIGRIDQFLLGIMAYQFKDKISGRHLLVFGVLTLFALFYWYFDSQGGFYKSPSYPSKRAFWIYMPTFEGVAYGMAIAWYDNSFKHSTGWISRFLALIGSYSYSIYLLHFFLVHKLSSYINYHILSLANIYLSMLFSVLCFFVMVPIGHVSYRFIESPFLKFRTKYIDTGKPRALRSIEERKNA